MRIKRMAIEREKYQQNTKTSILRKKLTRIFIEKYTIRIPQAAATES